MSDIQGECLKLSVVFPTVCPRKSVVSFAASQKGRINKAKIYQRQQQFIRPENQPSKFPGQRIGIGLAAEEGKIIGRKDYSREIEEVNPLQTIYIAEFQGEADKLFSYCMD